MAELIVYYRCQGTITHTHIHNMADILEDAFSLLCILRRLEIELLGDLYLPEGDMDFVSRSHCFVVCV